MAEAARGRRTKAQPDDALFDRELDHLPPEARWREWMNRVEATIFAASEPVGRETLSRIVGKSCSIELLIDDIREELRGRPYDLIAIAGGWKHLTRPAYADATAWIIDDTGFPKKGRHSVGVARQYCGQLGKQDNCQVVVSLSIANKQASLPIAWRLYLPEPWVQNPELRHRAKIPDSIGFQTKPQIALDQVCAAVAAGTPAGVILADAGYGADGAFRSGLSELGLVYVVGVQPTLSVWRPGEEPLPPAPWKGTGRPPSLMRRSPDHKPLSAKALARELPADAWQSVTWREGTNEDLASRFAAMRVRPASRDHNLTRPRPEEWLLVEWPEGDAEPLKYWLSTLPAGRPLHDLVATAKLRWRIERDYRELKQELGLGHYEGRGWRGFHHHASLCIAAYGFLICEREAIPPSAPAGPQDGRKSSVSRRSRPCTPAHSTRAPCLGLDRHNASSDRRRTRPQLDPMSLLHQN